jgi:hypothetical protein
MTNPLTTNPLTTNPTLQLSDRLYDLFQALPSEVQQHFLENLVKHHRSELEDLFFYLSCQEAREEGFLTDSEARNFLDGLPQ